MWTQQIFKEKHRFQNPLRQNYRHTKALEEILALPPESIMSIVVFIGDCKFKTTMPKNVFINAKYTSYIESFQDEKLSAYQFDKTIETLNQKRLKQSFSTDREHVANLHERHNTKPTSIKTCARCGKEMVLRHNRQTGEAFYGCSGYPKCKNIVKNT
jgi:DNA-directed RNA polymerase subunit M/transcription elongation factor TFIIS